MCKADWNLYLKSINSIFFQIQLGFLTLCMEKGPSGPDLDREEILHYETWNLIFFYIFHIWKLTIPYLFRAIFNKSIQDGANSYGRRFDSH